MPTSSSLSELTVPFSKSTTDPACQHDPTLADDKRVGQKPLPDFEEKRESPRFPFRGRTKAVFFPPPTSPLGTTLHDSEVVTSDLSLGGVSVLNRTPLVPGQQLLLMLNDHSQLAEVRWCRPVWEGLFAAGCQFLGEAGPASIDQQLAAIDVVISSEEMWWQADEST